MLNFTKDRGYMAKLDKNLCKIGKEGFKDFEKEIVAEVSNAQYICKKCIRAASRKELLCRPEKISTN
jgi:hypothetical protein